MRMLAVGSAARRMSARSTRPPQLSIQLLCASPIPPPARATSLNMASQPFNDGGVIDLPAAALPLTASNTKKLAEIERLLAGDGGFVALVLGPPGSGKKTAIARVVQRAGLSLTVTALNRGWSTTVAEMLPNRLQRDLFDGVRLLLNADCELAPNQRPKQVATILAKKLSQVRSEGGRALLVCNERTLLLKLALEDANKGLRTIWWDPFGDAATRKMLNGELGECPSGPRCPCNRAWPLDELQVRAALALCRGDARQALRNRCLLRLDAGAGSKDRPHHNPYHSTQRLLNDHTGKAASAEDVHEDWLAANLDHTSRDLEAAASFAADMALSDGLGLLDRDWGGQTFEQDSTRQLRELGQEISFSSARANKGPAHVTGKQLQGPPRQKTKVDDKLKFSATLSG